MAKRTVIVSDVTVDPILWDDVPEDLAVILSDALDTDATSWPDSFVALDSLDWDDVAVQHWAHDGVSLSLATVLRLVRPHASLVSTTSLDTLKRLATGQSVSVADLHQVARDWRDVPVVPTRSGMWTHAAVLSWLTGDDKVNTRKR